jgi:UDP-N-acetylmuramyl pentapeptide synthase
MRVGRGADCDLVAEHVTCAGDELSIVLTGLTVRVPVWGRHHLPSVLAAFAVGRLMGLSVEGIAAALTRFAPPEGRGSVASCEGVTVIDDSSCPSPTAARAALMALRDAARCGRRLAVIGEFQNKFRNPAATLDDYRRLGAAAVAHGGVDGLIACGAGAEQVVQAARESGMPERAAVVCPEKIDAAEAIAALVREGDTLLVVGGPPHAMRAIARAVTHRTSPDDANYTHKQLNNTRFANSFEVPPLAPALRESGAALPPGLEH